MKENFNILSIIPARGGSKGILRKNIKLINGKPLIYYAIKLAKQAEKKNITIGHIFSTDDIEIATIAKKYGGNVPFLRPANLAKDNSLIIGTILHAVKWWEKKFKTKIHSIILMQPTNPLTKLEDIEESVKYYLAKQPKADCLISICNMEHLRPNNLYYKKGEHLEQAFNGIKPSTRRQDLKRLYWRNGAIYIARRDLLFRKKTLLSSSPLYYEMPRQRSVSIDDEFDFLTTALLMSYIQRSKE